MVSVAEESQPPASWEGDLHVYREVHQERDRQDRLWGGPAHDDRHTRAAWLGFIGDQCDRIQDPPSFRERLVKIAALAIAAVEAYDRKNGADS